jgi:hypothetical protein
MGFPQPELICYESEGTNTLGGPSACRRQVAEFDYFYHVLRAPLSLRDLNPTKNQGQAMDQSRKWAEKFHH